MVNVKNLFYMYMVNINLNILVGYLYGFFKLDELKLL